jgi:hypothetical protein
MKYEARLKAVFCDGTEYTRNGPKLSEQDHRSAPESTEAFWLADQAENPVLTAEIMWDQEDDSLPDNISPDVHLASMTLETRAKYGEWTEIWSGTRESCPCTIGNTPLHNQALFPEKGAMFVYSERPPVGEWVEITASWCGHTAFITPENAPKALVVGTTICTDCGLKHFPDHYGKVLLDTMREHAPKLVTEIHRYSNPKDAWGFHYMEPDHSGTWGVYPYADDMGDDFDPDNHVAYKETGVYLHWADEVDNIRKVLRFDGYTPVPYTALPEPLQRYVAFRQAPIEWHKGLEANDPEVTSRIVVWADNDIDIPG